MKYLLLIAALSVSSFSMGQNLIPDQSGEKILVDNDKMKVVEHISQPEGDVCGLGMHHHEPHLTIVLTNSKVQITPEHGDTQDLEVQSGTTIWFDTAETHSVINSGDQPTKMILVYLKE